MIPRFLIVVIVALVHSAPVASQDHTPRYLDIGTPTVIDLYVDPMSGDDRNSGRSALRPFRTLTAAWGEIPENSTLSTGFRINLAPGTYPESAIPNYLESRHGTFSAPIIFRSSGPAGSAVLAGDLNVFDCRYLYIIGVTIRPAPAGDTFHCERCDHLLLRGSTFDGGNRAAHETIKINQSQNVFIENNNISGASDNALDFVTVQYGHLIGNRIHNAGDWCAYVKGGSAYLQIANNSFFDCGTGGFTAGQGTGFEFMESPWLHYEAYDIAFFNNVVHDTTGAAIGVNGGFNVVMAYNTFFRVGSRSHGIEVVFGLRSCDGDTARCAAHRALGGWGSPLTEEPIPNRNVFIFNNVLYNPPGFRSADQHLTIHSPRMPSHGTNIPAPARTDTNLVIRGNLVYNGPADLPLGIEEISGACDRTNPTCTKEQLEAENVFNLVEPRLTDPTNDDFRPLVGDAIVRYTGVLVPNFTDIGRPMAPPVPIGILTNFFPEDRGGLARGSASPPGAYARADSPIMGPTEDGIPPTPKDPVVNIKPRVVITSARVAVERERARISLIARCTDLDGSIARVTGAISHRDRRPTRLNLRQVGRNIYRRTVVVRATSRPHTGTVTAIDDGGASTTKRRSLVRRSVR